VEAAEGELHEEERAMDGKGGLGVGFHGGPHGGEE
jgi:hypothetical protein